MGVDMSEKRILCVKVDPEVFEEIERIARSRGVDKSKLLRELIEKYLLEGRGASEALSELDKLVLEAKTKMDALYKKWVDHCTQHAREVVERQPQLKEVAVKEDCLKSVRGLILIDLQSIAREHIMRIKSMNNIDNELKREYYKKIWSLIEAYQV